MQFEIHYDWQTKTFTLTGWQNGDIIFGYDGRVRYYMTFQGTSREDFALMFGVDDIDKPFRESIHKPKRWMKRMYLNKAIRETSELHDVQEYEAAYYGVSELCKLAPVTVTMAVK